MKYMEDYQQRYGEKHYISKFIDTQYGGKDFKPIRKQFASRIIFLNGLKDPYSSAGILDDISYTIVAVTTKQGSHCLDLMMPNNNEPRWLTQQIRKETKIMASWIKEAHQYSKNNA